MAMMDDDKDFGRTPDLNADAPGRRRGGKKRVCKFCADKAVVIDYKDRHGKVDGHYACSMGRTVVPGKSACCGYLVR